MRQDIYLQLIFHKWCWQNKITAIKQLKFNHCHRIKKLTWNWERSLTCQIQNCNISGRKHAEKSSFIFFWQGFFGYDENKKCRQKNKERDYIVKNYSAQYRKWSTKRNSNLWSGTKYFQNAVMRHQNSKYTRNSDSKLITRLK